jgi:hypothetical protein
MADKINNAKPCDRKEKYHEKKLLRKIALDEKRVEEDRRLFAVRKSLVDLYDSRLNLYQ